MLYESPRQLSLEQQQQQQRKGQAAPVLGEVALQAPWPRTPTEQHAYFTQYLEPVPFTD